MSSPFHSQTFSKKPFGECISHNGCVLCVLKGSTTQMNSFAFHELQSQIISHSLPARAHITQICLPSCHILMLTDWMLTQMAQSAHTITPQTVRHFVFSRGFPAMWRRTARGWIMVALFLFGCCSSFGVAVCGGAWLPGISYCMWQNTQAISRLILPCFLWQGQSHKLHYYLRRKTEQAVSQLLFVKSYFRGSSLGLMNKWYHFLYGICVVWTYRRDLKTNVRTLQWLSALLQTEKMLSRILHIETNILHMYVLTPPFFFWSSVCMIWCGCLTGFAGPGWSHNTLE